MFGLAAPALLGMHFAKPKTVTDVIHRSIDLHPFCVAVIDTPEFQRLRHIGQLGTCRWVFPGAVHDRFQHSLGVAHLAESWTTHFRRTQPELGITDSDVLCVTLAGLLHDLGHGPYSHFWEGWKHAAHAQLPEHEELSCSLLDRLLARGEVDPSPWLTAGDLEFVKALILGAPPDPPSDGDCYADPERAQVMRCGTRGVVGSDKRFLYEIVANQRSGFDVDKLDYFERHDQTEIQPAAAAHLPCADVLHVWLCLLTNSINVSGLILSLSAGIATMLAWSRLDLTGQG